MVFLDDNWLISRYSRARNHCFKEARRKVTMKTVEIPVLIVGGGPVGLCASILLSQHGVPSLLVECHTETSLYPKARLVNTRTMEIFRACGLEQPVRKISLPPEQSRYAIWARTLAGEERQRRAFDTVTADLSEKVSPTVGCTTSQEVLEPVLLNAARQCILGQVRFGCELTTFIQDDSGVSATLLDREQGEQIQVWAQYLIGADGAHSLVREVLGVPMIGPAGLGHTMNILFQADLSRWVSGRSINLAFIQHPDAPGVLVASDGKRRWVFQAFYSPAAGQRAEDFTQERCVELVRTAAGVPDLPVEFLRAAPWTSSARVAERFRQGRVFLAGDAAHEMTPAGGFGMNTGIQDIHNLAWKLAAVLEGWARPALLESYECERQPVDRWITEQTLHNLASIRRLGSEEASADTSMHEGRQEFFHEQGMIFAATYDSAVVIPDGTARPVVANPVTEYIPSAHPGCRAPHVWLDRTGQQLSTLDLFGTSFVLLAGQTGAAWCQAATEVAPARHVPLHAFTIGVKGNLVDPGGSWATTYGVEQDGAVLVRPDGHVAWRTRSSATNPAEALQRVFASMHGERPSQRETRAFS
jgi:2-polyprenyl-6-methoxyphenol hydroxylase-like FAD-dependent oxidoreductase